MSIYGFAAGEVLELAVCKNSCMNQVHLDFYRPVSPENNYLSVSAF